jgi:uncharacterized glyoxalase superfamily protein PhnB
VISNRSVPTEILLPHIVYQDVGKAIAWLTNAFGFSEHYRYGEPGEPNGAQMYLGNAWIMLRGPRQGEASPAELGYGTQSLTVFVSLWLTRRARRAVPLQQQAVVLHSCAKGRHGGRRCDGQRHAGQSNHTLCT